MTQLGKPLIFYLKYMAEMTRVYGDPEEGEEPFLTGLDDGEHVREMIHAVGVAADRQAVDFLELCGRRIEEHFRGLGITTLAKKKTRTYVLNNWSWEADFHVSAVAGSSFWCGVYLTASSEVDISMEKGVCGVVVPWVWAQGGHKAADAIWKYVDSWAHSRGGDGLSDDEGTVDLACIPIKPQPPENFNVDRDPLIAEVMKAIGRIGAKETKAIAKYVASLKESKEG